MKHWMIRIVSVISFLAPCAFSEQFEIKVTNFKYEPSTLTISEGDTVLFKWISGNHPTQFESQMYPLFPMNSGNTEKTLVFSETGDFPYVCISHENLGMTGIIQVDENASIGRADTQHNGLVIRNAGERIILSGGQNIVEEIELLTPGGNRILSIEIPHNKVNWEVEIPPLPKGIYFFNYKGNNKKNGIKLAIGF